MARARAVCSGVTRYVWAPSARSAASSSMRGRSAARRRGTGGRSTSAALASGLSNGEASIASRYARIVATGRA
jgi:hypothetical protein